MFTLYRNYILLHLIVIIFGFTGIIGAMISVSPDKLIWFRTLVAGTIIFLYGKYKKSGFNIGRKKMLQLLATGLIIAIHWIGFYGAIKVSNVSVTLVCFASSSFFAALLEPLFYKRKIDAREVLFGVLVMACIGFIFSIETKYVSGVLLGLLAALTSAIFTIINGRFAGKIESSVISFYEMAGGFIGITIYFLLGGNFTGGFFTISTNDWILLGVLSIFCTAFTFVLSVEIMKELSPYTVVLSVNLEPVYGIVLAYFILDEGKHLNWKFYIGACLILLIVFANSYLKPKQSK